MILRIKNYKRLVNTDVYADGIGTWHITDILEDKDYYSFICTSKTGPHQAVIHIKLCREGTQSIRDGIMYEFQKPQFPWQVHRVTADWFSNPKNVGNALISEIKKHISQ